MKLVETLGVLLVNTGSPDAPETAPTRRYLRQFLSDPRVIDIAAWKRRLLLELVILPFRPKKSAHAYQQIWTAQGSPLIANSRAFCEALKTALPGMEIEIGMAYGNPSVPRAIDTLLARKVSRVLVAPMFPQYASATFGSVLEAVYGYCAHNENVPRLTTLPPFYRDEGFLDAWAENARAQLDAFKPDHILFSYHGLPERQIRKSDPTGRHCLRDGDCCERYLDGNPDCYRAHCFATTRGIVERLGIAKDMHTVAFQSKLGRDPWLQPAADVVLVEKAKSGVKRLAVLSPAFVADCLETIEELGLRGKEDFIAHGGTDFLLVPSLNAHPAWVRAFAGLVRDFGVQ